MEDSQPDALRRSMRTYACRLARLCFLKGHCHEPDHPVLQTEIQLVEMARSKLMEQVMMKFGPKSTGLESIEHELRAMAQCWISSSVDDEDEREIVMNRLEQTDFDWLGHRSN